MVIMSFTGYVCKLLIDGETTKRESNYYTSINVVPVRDQFWDLLLKCFSKKKKKGTTPLQLSSHGDVGGIKRLFETDLA